MMSLPTVTVMHPVVLGARLSHCPGSPVKFTMLFGPVANQSNGVILLSVKRITETRNVLVWLLRQLSSYSKVNHLRMKDRTLPNRNSHLIGV